MGKQTNISQALWEFFNGFMGVTARRKGTIFSEDEPQQFPLLLYPVDLYDSFEQGFLQVSVYDNIGDWSRLDKFSDDLSEIIGEGITLKVGKGYLNLFKGSPWAQQQPTEDNTKALYFIIQANYNL